MSSGAGGGCSNDQAEPNNNETAPTELGTTSDCDNPQLVAGVLPSGDEDGPDIEAATAAETAGVSR